MLLGVNYIHKKSIVHRDLKLENFLYEKQDGDHLKLIDFGFSKVWEKNTKMDLSCGTLAYVAPEVLRKSYTSQCDLWSLGVIAFILLFGYMPFAGPEGQQQRDIKAGTYIKRPEKWSKVSATAQNFVESLLVVDTSIRLTAEQALNHDFIKHLETERGSVQDTAVDSNIAEALMGFAEASNFRRACMSVMAWSLTNEERAKVRDAFLRIDTNRTGTITLKELKDVLVNEFDVEDEKSQQIFAALDTAQNDEIHYSEFLAAMVSTRIAMHDGLLKATFQKFDVDNSGFISLDNLKEVLGDSFDGAEVTRLVTEADRDKDGQISYNEFITFLKDGGGSEQHNEAAGMIIDNAHRDEALMKDAQAGSAVVANHGGLKAKQLNESQAPKTAATASPTSPQKEQRAAEAPPQATNSSKTCMIL
jgi:calcium-dependent protein kinase